MGSLFLPQPVADIVHSIHVVLRFTVGDKPIWKADNSGTFSVASAWNLFRKKKQKAWVYAMKWQKVIHFKMFIVERTEIRYPLMQEFPDKITTD